MSKIWTTPHFVRVSNDLLNNNPNRPKLEPLDILIFSTLCGWTNVEDPKSGHYNWESLETWGKRFGTNKDTAARSFRRLTGLGLVRNFAIKHQGRTKPLRYVALDKLREWVNPEAHTEGWPFVAWVDDGTGKRQKKTVPLRNDAASKKLLGTFDERLQLTPPETIRAQVIEKMHAVSPRLLFACCIYAGVNPDDYYPLHPIVQEGRRKQMEQAAERKAERAAVKKARAKTLQNMIKAMQSHNNQLSQRDRLDESLIQREAANCLSHYEINQWQMSGGRHVASVDEVAGPWLDKVASNINRAKANERARQAQESKSRMSWAYDLQKEYEERTATASANPETIDIEHEEMG